VRIAMVVSQFPTLSETFILAQITGLLDMGHDVQVFPLFRREEPKVHPAVEEYGLLERTHQPPFWHAWNQTPAAAASLLHLMLSRPVQGLRLLAHAPRKHGLPHRGALIHCEPLLLAHEREPFDIIHAQFGTMGHSTMALRRVCDVPFVVNFRGGGDTTAWARRKGPGAYDELWRTGDLFMTVCDYLRQRVIGLGAPAEKVVTHYSVSPIEEITFRERHRPSDGPVELLTVARLAEMKGLEYSIRAVHDLRRRGYDVHYRVAGDGPLRADLERLVGDLGLHGTVELLGWCSREEVLRLLDQASLFVLASVTGADGSHEGMAVVLREAQAAGLPVVTTDHAGNPEALIDGASGFVVPERDADALVDRLAWLMDRPEVWGDFGRRGRELVEERFDVRKLNRRLVNIYTHAIEGRLPFSE